MQSVELESLTYQDSWSNWLHRRAIHTVPQKLSKTAWHIRFHSYTSLIVNSFSYCLSPLATQVLLPANWRIIIQNSLSSLSYPAEIIYSNCETRCSETSFVKYFNEIQLFVVSGIVKRKAIYKAALLLCKLQKIQKGFTHSTYHAMIKQQS